MEKSFSHPYCDPDLIQNGKVEGLEDQAGEQEEGRSSLKFGALELPSNPVQENYRPLDAEFIMETPTCHLVSRENLHRISIAPMFDVTNTHFRFFMRLITRCATLWTEMIHFSALDEDDQKRDFHLRFHPCEQPVVC